MSELPTPGYLSLEADNLALIRDRIIRNTPGVEADTLLDSCIGNALDYLNWAIEDLGEGIKLLNKQKGG